MMDADPVALVDMPDPRRWLPPEEGSLILVLGGTAVLVLSLTVALVTGRSPLRRGSPTPSVGPRPKRSVDVGPAPDPPPGPRSRLSLHQTLLKTTARAGVGTPQIVTENPGPHALVLVDCLNCRPSADGEGCQWKRASLEQALRQFDPDGRVAHVSCEPEEPRACVFEIRTGDVAT